MTLPSTVGIAEQGTETHTTDQQVEIARWAADAGFDFLLVPETWGRDAFTRAGYIAARTDIAIGTGLVPVHSRSPALLAQSIATVAELADGALLGLGLSSDNVVEQWHGVAFEPALRRQRETIEIVRQALSGEPLEYDGTVFDVEHFRMRFEPDPDIPICVGAQGPKNCELTGGFADQWWPNRIPLSSLDSLREHVDTGASKQGRDPADVDTVPFVTTCVLDDGDRARACAAAEIAHYIGAMGEYTKNALEKCGYGEVARTVDERWQRGERDGAIDAVSADVLDEITISGTPEQARETLDRYGSECDGAVLLPSKDASLAEVEETIDHVGDWL
ncbi:LLM class flavin-dependent oxidoreductase [Halovivax limisalsi]|uniref:LLM class flavin-dependent oxidoreductase n=1 Tax=Halovivax limisalsi TaxID=1453760 RepID=UPI001FFDA7DE|nr:LLM class flavin-dependent oxidoreductase [Halovivax limisalsi]